MTNVLEVRNLKTHFFTDEGVVKAVDDVSFSVERGKTLGLVGESGCGKSVTAMSISRLVSPPGRIVAGEILLNGRNLVALSDRGDAPGSRSADFDDFSGTHDGVESCSRSRFPDC